MRLRSQHTGGNYCAPHGVLLPPAYPLAELPTEVKVTNPLERLVNRVVT